MLNVWFSYSKRTTCGCFNKSYDWIFYVNKKYCANSCNSGNDDYCGDTYYAAIYEISNSTTGISC